MYAIILRVIFIVFFVIVLALSAAACFPTWASYNYSVSGTELATVKISLRTAQGCQGANCGSESDISDINLDSKHTSSAKLTYAFCILTAITAGAGIVVSVMSLIGVFGKKIASFRLPIVVLAWVSTLWAIGALAAFGGGVSPPFADGSFIKTVAGLPSSTSLDTATTWGLGFNEMITSFVFAAVLAIATTILLITDGKSKRGSVAPAS